MGEEWRAISLLLNVYVTFHVVAIGLFVLVRLHGSGVAGRKAVRDGEDLNELRYRGDVTPERLPCGRRDRDGVGGRFTRSGRIHLVFLMVGVQLILLANFRPCREGP